MNGTDVYVLVVADTTPKLVKECNDLMKKGYIPIGGPFIWEDASEHYSNRKPRRHQTMVMKEYMVFMACT